VAEPPIRRSQAEPGNERWSAFALSMTAMPRYAPEGAIKPSKEN